MGYFPNGTSGMAYEEQYCLRCTHHGGPDGPMCPVFAAHMMHNYTDDEDMQDVLNLLIPRDGAFNAQCAMFHANDQTISLWPAT